MVVEDHANVVTLIHLDSWAWGGAVKAPQIERLIGQDCLLYRLGDQIEHLGSVVHRERQVCSIGRSDWDVACGAAAAAGCVENGARGAGVGAAACSLVGKEARSGNETRTKAQRTLEKTASIAHEISLL